MSKLINCPSCDKEVSKSAKVCPSCGKKLKMGMFLKLIIGIGVLIVLGIALSPSKEEAQMNLVNKLNEVKSSEVSNLKPTGELDNIFSLNSNYTDLQRDNKEKEIIGQVVQWRLKVYEVNLKDQEKRLYKIQTASSNSVGTFVNLYAMDDEQEKIIQNLKTDDRIMIKGVISGTFMRNIEIKDAVLIQ